MNAWKWICYGLLLLALGCDFHINDVTEADSNWVDPQQSATQEEAGYGEPQPVKLDVLWVIDNSVSMCQEQNSLAEHVDGFLEELKTWKANLRMAVVTTDGLSSSESGAFHAALAPPYPPNCFEKVAYECLTPSPGVEDACASAFGPIEATVGKWVCEPPPQNAAANLTNNNGSVNSNCRYKCVDDADCVSQFGNPDMQCVAPGGDENQRGCLAPPSLSDLCLEAENLPLYVETDAGNLDLFSCLAVVGALQDPNPQLEQGLNTAVWALDKNPPMSQWVPDRSAQASDFLRPDAYQLIVFVSDEDDCSLAPGMELPKELHQTCACQPTVAFKSGGEWQGGYLVPVSSITTQLRSINADLSKVFVATIVGDVLMTDEPIGSLLSWEVLLSCYAATGDVEDCVESKRVAYTESKCGPKFTDRNTYVCASNRGKADYGSRYLELVRQFGNNGVSANICAEEGLGPGLTDIAATIGAKIQTHAAANPTTER